MFTKINRVYGWKTETGSINRGRVHSYNGLIVDNDKLTVNEEKQNEL